MAAVETAPQTGAKTRDPDAPVTFTLDQIKRVVAPKTRRYWIGVYHDAPFDHGSADAVGFLKYKGPPPVDDDGTFNEGKIQARGDVVALTDEQLAKFSEAVRGIVLRVGHVTSQSVDPKTGQARTRFVIKEFIHLNSVDFDVRKDRDGKPQTQRTWDFTENHVPLGYFLYCIPLRESMPTNWRDEKTPPRMCDTSSMVMKG